LHAARLFLTKAPLRFGFIITHAMQVGSFWGCRDSARTQTGGHTGFVILPNETSDAIALYAPMQMTAVIAGLITYSE